MRASHFALLALASLLALSAPAVSEPSQSNLGVIVTRTVGPIPAIIAWDALCEGPVTLRVTTLWPSGALVDSFVAQLDTLVRAGPPGSTCLEDPGAVYRAHLGGFRLDDTQGTHLVGSLLDPPASDVGAHVALAGTYRGQPAGFSVARLD